MRLVLCDDHQMFIEALAVALAVQGHQIEATVTEPSRLADTVKAIDPAVCILDITFPDGNGIDTAREVIAGSPDTKILILSATTDSNLVRRAFEAGVLGFVQKDESIDGVLSALDRLGNGEVAVNAGLLRDAMRGAQHVAAEVKTPARLRYLTGRERDVLRYIVAGWSTADIARSLGVTTSTARTHIQNVLVKLGAHSRLQAAAMVVSEGLLPDLQADSAR